MKNILVTGVSTGIGYGITMEFIRKGYFVFGSVRKKEDADKLTAEFGRNFAPLIFDITDRKAVANAVNIVKERIGNEGLSGLINNAGTALACPLMLMPVENFRNQLEVLVTGHLNVIQEFLPLLGAEKNSAVPPGRIINISSVNGKFAAPFLGSYVAAKHALEGMSAVLRIELQIYGIDVIIVGPGMVKTAIWNKAPDESAEEFRDTDYHLPVRKFYDFIREKLPRSAFESDEFSERLVKIFESRKPKTRYSVVKNKFLDWTLPGVIPARLKDKIIGRLFGLKKVEHSLLH